MLGFCGEHGIGAQVEVIDADRIDEAYDRSLPVTSASGSSSASA